MCVLSYVPLPNGQFIFTNNRDESLARPKAIEPAHYTIAAESVVMAKDAKAHGTWIAASQSTTICLLNGAFAKHIPKPPYLYSRGQIILDYFSKNWSFDTLTQHTFAGVENFTLIVHNPKQNLFKELVWDSNKLYSKDLNAKVPLIWSSCTLYDPDIVQLRSEAFYEYLGDNPHPNAYQLQEFHTYTDLGNDSHNFRLNRPDGIVTQCVVQVCVSENGKTFNYHDLIAHNKKSLTI